MQNSQTLSLVCIVDEVDSTNEFLQNIAIEYKNKYIQPILFFSKVQSKGKGRGGKSFYSPKGGIYFSLLFTEPNLEPNLSLKVALFIIKKLKKLYNLPFKIRWPNDLILEDMKFGGILVEVKENSVIVGVGLNLTKDISSKIKDQKVTYLNKYIKRKLKIEEFYNLVEKWFSSNFFKFIKSPINLNEWERYSYFKEGDLLKWEGGREEKNGIYKGISKEGFLKVEVNGEIKNLTSVEKINKLLM